MLSKPVIVKKLIALVAEHLSDHCRGQAECPDCIYHRKGGCVFDDIPMAWDVKSLDDGSEN